VSGGFRSRIYRRPEWGLNGSLNGVSPWYALPICVT